MTAEADFYRLQCLDSEGDKRRRRLAEVEAMLGESKELDRAQRAVEEVQTYVRKWEVRQRDQELEIQGLSNKITREEQRLYSGTIRNPKELQDMQAEVASLNRRRQQLEEALLETMIELEEAQSGLTQAKEHLAAVRASWTTDQAELGNEHAALKARLAEIEQAREAVLPNIDAGDLAVYQGLRPRKGGVAVVPVEAGACGGCGVVLPPSLEWQLREGHLTTCGNCERILVRVK
jgi:predicted  nucleic acid-binding Zn-ribbon protein